MIVACETAAWFVFNASTCLLLTTQLLPLCILPLLLVSLLSVHQHSCHQLLFLDHHWNKKVKRSRPTLLVLFLVRLLPLSAKLPNRHYCHPLVRCHDIEAPPRTA